VFGFGAILALAGRAAHLDAVRRLFDAHERPSDPVRIALISDIHGNLLALEAVLAEIRELQVDEMVCLGDVATLGPEPEAVVRRLEDLNAPCILGNHDSYALSGVAPSSSPNMPDWMQAQVRWASEQLSPASLEFLRSLKDSVRIALSSSSRLLCVHGSPRSNEEMVLSTTSSGELDAMLEGLQVDVLAHGHSHIQMARRHRSTFLLNPGSVGEPLAQMPFEQPEILQWAEYALLEARTGNLRLELRRVPYDVSALVLQFKRSSMPDAGFWIDIWSRSPSLRVAEPRDRFGPESAPTLSE
jgi:putative phosphoesterase